MTNLIASLPTYRATVGVSTDEDFDVSIAFLKADGSALSLSGISFAMQIGSDITLSSDSGGGLSVIGDDLNILWAFVPAETKAAWPTGVLSWACAASDGTYTRAVFGGASTVTHIWGARSPLKLTQLR